MNDEPENRLPAERSEPTGEAPSWIDRIGEMPLLAYLDKWRQRFRTHPQTGLPMPPLRERRGLDALSIERLAFSTGRGLRILLQLFTPVCFSLFLLSFAISHPLLREIVKSASIAGLIGFGTNWIAIKMLFRPRETRPVFGQGLIPSQRDEIIRKVADEVIEKLINERIIKQELDESKLITRLTDATGQEIRRLFRDPEFVRDTKQLVLSFAARVAKSEAFRDELIQEVEKRVEQVAGRSFTRFFVNRLRGVWRDPLHRLVDAELERLPDTLDRLVGEVDDALDHVPQFLESRQDAIDASLTRIIMSLVRELDMHHVILKQLSTVTSDQLETGFREFADDKLSYITLLGGILGLVGGFVIVWPKGSVLALAALLALLFVADVVLYRVLRWHLRAREEAHGEAADIASEPERAPEAAGP